MFAGAPTAPAPGPPVQAPQFSGGRAGTLLPTVWDQQQTPFTNVGAGDEMCMASQYRSVYLAWQNSGTALLFAKSTDEGGTWSGTTTVAANGAPPLDIPMCVDPITGVIHLFFVQNIDQAGSPAILLYTNSSDGGTTWSAPLTVDDGTAHGNNRFVRIACAAYSGSVYAAYTFISDTDFSTDGLIVIISTNGGTSFTSQTPFAATAVSPVRPFLAFVAPSTIHLVWADSRWNLPGVVNLGDAVYGRSADGGTTWSWQRMSNTAGVECSTGAVQRPCLCADGQNVTVIYQDGGARQGAVGTAQSTGQGKQYQMLYAVHSSDGGNTFAAPVKVNSNDGSYTNEHSFPAIRGSLMVLTYEDQRNLLGGANAIGGASISQDGGATWGTETCVTTQAGYQAPALVLTPHYAIAAWANSPNLNISRYDLTGVPVTTTALDNFTRANTGPPPSTSWTLGPTDFTAGEGLIVLSNQAVRKSTGSFRQGDYWNPATFGPDCEAWVTIGALGAANNDGFTIYLRLTSIGSGTTNGYNLEVDWSSTLAQKWSINKTTAGAASTLLGNSSFRTPGRRLAIGDTVLFRVIGSTLEAWWLPVGGQGGWLMLGSVQDGTFTGTGNVGLELLNSQSMRIASFGASTVVTADSRVIAPQQAQGVSMSRQVLRASSASQAQVNSQARALVRALAASQAQVSSASRAPTRALTLTQTQAPTVPLVVARVMGTATQAQTLSFAFSNVKFVNLTASQAQTLTIGRQTQRALSAPQGQAMTMARGVARALATSQAQQFAVTFSRARFVNMAATQGQAGTVARMLRRALSASQAQSTTAGDVVARALVVAQPQAATTQLTITRGAATSQTQTAALSLMRSAQKITLAVTQGQQMTLGCACTRTLSLSQTQSSVLFVVASNASYGTLTATVIAKTNMTATIEAL